MNPKTYMVGGAVRDLLLGRKPKDIDYVVVGANHRWMIEQGFTQVGVTFPVYMHPETGQEYALARREKKTGPGYNGFEVETENVTIEEDLSRRDLTINSMAIDEDGTLIDPYGGYKDLMGRILKHTSDAFAEDPIRVLRTARFAARYDFDVQFDTIEFSRKIAHEIDDVDPNRVWLEIRKAIREPYIDQFFDKIWSTCSRRSKMMDSIYPLHMSFRPNVHHQIFVSRSPTEVLVAAYLTPSNENGASKMEIELHQMFNEFSDLAYDSVGQIRFIMKWRLLQDCDRTEWFLNAGMFLFKSFDEFVEKRTILKNYQMTDDQKDHLSKCKGKEARDYIEDVYICVLGDKECL
ncbi:MAG TPA: hypothetical protein VFM18_07230 [Methanosarcina sp.]|nr:hypothetical protein [Methanosarcina sp.]